MLKLRVTSKHKVLSCLKVLSANQILGNQYELRFFPSSNVVNLSRTRPIRKDETGLTLQIYEAQYDSVAYIKNMELGRA
jgi:hypothetical protein